jgi:uncharacterized protein
MPMKSYGSVKVFYPEYTRNELIEKLRQGVRKLADKLPLDRVVLFGSWSRSRHTAFSDVDLMIIYTGPERDDAFALVKEVVAVKGLEPHIYTSEQAARLPVLDRMTAGGVAIFPEQS